jgi:SpoIID/LytB domain protein
MENRKFDLNHVNGEPIIRVGVFQGQDHIDFILKEPFDIQDLEGNVLAANVHNSHRWRVKIKEQIAGKEIYELILFETPYENHATDRLKEAKQLSEEVKLELVGGEIYLNGEFINENVRYRLVYGEYSDENKAKKDLIRFRPEFNPVINKKVIKDPIGRIEIFDSEYEYSIELDGGVRVVPHNPNALTHFLEIVKYDTFFQKEYKKDYYYNGTLELRFDATGDLMAINELPLEIYLRRAVFSESEAGLPKDFYKSMAIVIRSEILARIGHQHVTEPFDVCDWGHCLRFYGEKFDDPNIDEAIAETRGMVLRENENSVLDAHFNLICGGHTEDPSGVWDIDEDPPYKGKYDYKIIPDDFSGLQDEDVVKKWINNRPAAFCNLHNRQVPKSLLVTNKYFRWEVYYPRKELEELIIKNVGIDLGELIDILPVRRGRSGRLKELQLIGSLKTITLRGELNIRSALAHDYLDSSCFYVEKEFDDSGFPISFTLLGAGQGHGVGMCKTGACVMALEGFHSEQILEHYFENVRIEKIYE